LNEKKYFILFKKYLSVYQIMRFLVNTKYQNCFWIESRYLKINLLNELINSWEDLQANLVREKKLFFRKKSELLHKKNNLQIKMFQPNIRSFATPFICVNHWDANVFVYTQKLSWDLKQKLDFEHGALLLQAFFVYSFNTKKCMQFFTKVGLC